VSAILQDVYYALKAEERVGQRDLLKELQKLAGGVSSVLLVRGIEAVSKLKGELQFNVNRQLALEAMFLSLKSSK